MSGEETTKESKTPSANKFIIIRILISLTFLAISIYIAITLISGRGFNFDWFTDLLYPNERGVIVDEMNFNIGRSKVFADLNNAIAAAGSLGIQVINFEGSETLRESFSMNSPAISYSNGFAIAFDIGGTEARVFNSNEVFASISTNGPIVSASINPNRWFTINAQEGEGYRGTTTVYNDIGIPVYRVSLASGYILTSALSYDNNSLAILNLTEYGSRITFYHDLNKEHDDGALDFPDCLVLDISFLPNGDLLTITSESIIIIDPFVYSRWEIINFADLRIGGYAISDDYIALHLLDFGIGHKGKLIIIDHFGNLYGEIAIDRELISMSLTNDYLSVMLGDGLVLLDRSLTILPSIDESPSAAGVSQVLSLDIGATLIAGDRFAVILDSP